MKNLICLSAFIFAFVFQTNASNRPDDHSALNVIEDQKTIILNLSKIKAYSFEVFDENGASVYSQEIEKFKTGVKYVMSSLPTGQYTIKIEGDNFLEKHHAIITADSLIVESSETFFRPSIIAQNNKIIVNANLDNKEEIHLYIYDKDDNLEYKFSDQETGSYKRIFDLNKLNKRHYTVVVATDHFNESIKISL